MKINIIFIISAAVLMVPLNIDFLWGESGAYDNAGENIQYLIKPLGQSEYNDLGLVDLNGSKVNLVMFKTKVLLFEDTEKIYSDPNTLLPLRIERNISNFWVKEYITEDYDQKKFTVTLKKYDGNKIIHEQIIKANGPIYNGITLPFYMRKIEGLKIGWRFTVRIPNDEFIVELVSIDEITIPAGRFQAYHFKSIPDKVEIWVGKNSPRVTLKIQGKGIFDYVLLMKRYKEPYNTA